jgi:hypothetical protein
MRVYVMPCRSHDRRLDLSRLMEFDITCPCAAPTNAAWPRWPAASSWRPAAPPRRCPRAPQSPTPVSTVTIAYHCGVILHSPARSPPSVLSLMVVMIPLM